MNTDTREPLPKANSMALENWLECSWGRLGWSVGCIALIVICIKIGYHVALILMVAFIVALVWGNIPSGEGMWYRRFCTTFASWLDWLMRRQKVRSTAIEVYGNGMLPNTTPNPLGAELKYLDVVGPDGGYISYFKVGNTCTFVLFLESFTGAVTMDAGERHVWNHRTVQLLFELSKIGVKNVTIGRWQLPTNERPTMEHIMARVDPSFLEGNPKREPHQIRCLDNLGTALEQDAALSADILPVVTFTVPHSVAWGTSRLSDTITQQVFASAAATRMMRRAIELLKPMGLLAWQPNPIELTAMTRAKLCPVDAEDIYRLLARDERLVEGSLHDLVTIANGPWPYEIDAGNDWAWFDGVYHRYFRVEGFGSGKDAEPDFLDPALVNMDQRCWVSWTWVAKLHPAGKFRTSRTLERNWQGSKESGALRDYRREQKSDEMEERHAATSLTMGDVAKHAWLVDLATLTREDLKAMTTLLKENLAKQNMRVSAVKRKERQRVAALKTLGINLSA